MSELLVGQCAVLVFVAELCVLRGDDDSVDANGLVVRVILDRDLALAVGAKVGHLAGLADLTELERQLVRERDGRGHQLGGLIGGVAEHHALVAGAAGIHALRDVGALGVDGGDDGAGVRVEALERVVVADLLDGVADERLHIEMRLGGDLAGDDDEPGAGEGLARHAAEGVHSQAGVEDGVRDLVGDLVGVTLGYGLTGKEKTVGVGQSGRLLGRADVGCFTFLFYLPGPG